MKNTEDPIRNVERWFMDENRKWPKLSFHIDEWEDDKTDLSDLNQSDEPGTEGSDKQRRQSEKRQSNQADEQEKAKRDRGSGSKSTKKFAGSLRRKRIVLIEWAAIAVIAVVLIVAGSRLLFHQNKDKEGDSPKQISETTAAEEEVPAGGSQSKTYLLSFAGDCTIGSLLEWQGTLPEDFQSVVGEDYAYPFSGVKDIFAADDLTIVNFEGTLTTAEDAVEKPYRLKADPSYVQVLTEGSIEAVSIANNHSGDFKEQGRADTLAALESAGILVTDAAQPLIYTLDGGMKLGVVSYNTVDNDAGEWAWRSSVQADIERCKAEGCNLIIGFMHWGSVEYLTEPEAWEVQFAHDMVDWGCSLIVGGHAHILQRMEYYNEVPIFYSMGNFCFGGNTNPDDKDSVIVQAEFLWAEGEGQVRRRSLRVIPCLISSRKDLNDYCPTPCEEGSEDYQRILEKLEWKLGT